MEKVILKKENGKVEVFSANSEIVKNNTENCLHLCWENCANACPNKCQKVADIKKEKIDKYDFITDGLQVLNDKGQVDTFIVTNCQNFEREKPRFTTNQERARLMRLKEAMRMAYFDTETIEEAYIVQAELEARGELKNIRGRKPNEKELNIMRSRLR